MPSARIWRVVGVQVAGGGDLELSELHLYGSAGRLDAGATLTSSHAPVTGALAALSDGSTAASCIFAGTAVRSAGFWLQWELVADGDVVAVRPGSGVSNDRYLAHLELQYRDTAGQWVTAFTLGQFQWPGVRALDVAPSVDDPYFANVAALLPMTGAAGSTAFNDVKGGVWTPAGGAVISAAKSFFGSGSGWFDGDARILLPHASAPDLSNGDFTIEFLVRFTATNVYHVMVNKGFATGVFAYQVWVNNDNTFGFRGASAGGGEVDLNILGGSVAAGVDYFVSARRSGNVFTLHVNNVLIGSRTLAGSRYANTAPISVGAYENGVAGLQGYIGQFRITTGVARTTVVPSAAWPTSVGSGQSFDPLRLRTRSTHMDVAAAVPVPAFAARTLPGLDMARDIEHGGAGRIWGATKTKGTMTNVPTKARVVLLHQRSKLPVRETWSDPVTGAFAFEGIDTRQEFLTLAEDAVGSFRPVAASRLLPEVQP